ncbi:hypothetical protein [Nocardia terpenica]|uniref:hypothetical protein n=1 Tax=Nocardia terpenica TaxID=455432 RepID=UPI0012FE264E|nr:hypothetical protein [Nocardia terpenica]
MKTPLQAALEQFCRTGARRLTVEAVAASGGEIMRALTGVPAPDDVTVRIPLAEWIVNHLLQGIGAVDDPIDHRIAEVAFAACKEFHGKTVNQRITYVTNQRTRVFSVDQYWERHPRVVAEITTNLVHAYRQHREQTGRRAPTQVNRPARQTIRPIAPVPTIFLAGYYPGNAWDDTATALGVALAQLPVPVNFVSMASKAPLLVGYAMAAQSKLLDSYTPERYTLYRRTGSRRPQPILRYLGRTECLPGDVDEARRYILDRSDLTIVLAGDNGTAYETQLADQRGIPVIPVAATGAFAGEYWNVGSIITRVVGPGVAPDYHDLANPDLNLAVRATAHLTTYLLTQYNPRRR